MDIAMNVVCPTLGVFLSNCLFAAPVLDLKRALKAGTLGDLNPSPFPMQTGNCLGWIVYAYYTGCDPFLLASNIPGLIVSLWLNSGAAKLQYLEGATQRMQQPSADVAAHSTSNNNNNNNNNEEANDTVDDNQVTAHDNPSTEDEWDRYAPLIDNGDGSAILPSGDDLVTVPVERLLLQVTCFWAVVIVGVTFTLHAHAAAAAVGVIVNVNLIFFYAAPLQTMKHVISSQNSASIHRLTMYMNWFSTSFWLAYGIARMDYYIMIPNALGLAMGLTM